MKAAIVVGSVLALALMGCAPAEPQKVEYLVTGTASLASLTYTNAQGGTEQVEVALPWSQSFEMAQGSHLYISAQNQGEYGTITCEITVGGQPFKRSDSSGAYKIAGCSGRLGQ